MACQGCGSENIELCQCSDGKNSFTVSTTNTTIANPMTIAVSNVGQNTGAWAKVGQVVFIEGYGYYKCNSSTSTSITVAFPPSPFVGGATYSLGSVDYDNSGTIPSGTKISPGGVKGDTGVSNSAIIEQISHDSLITSSTVYAPLATKTIAAGSLSQAGDTLHIYAKFYFKYAAGQANVQITIGGITITLIPGFVLEPALSQTFPYLELELFATWASATTANIRVIYNSSDFGGGSYATETIFGFVKSYFTTYEIIGTGVITWANSNDVVINGLVTDPGSDLKLGFYNIENLQKI